MDFHCIEGATNVATIAPAEGLHGRNLSGSSPDEAVAKAVETFLQHDDYAPGDTLTYRLPKGNQIKIVKWRVTAVRRDDLGGEAVVTTWGATPQEIEAYRKGTKVPCSTRPRVEPEVVGFVTILEVDPIDLLKKHHRTVCVR